MILSFLSSSAYGLSEATTKTNEARLNRCLLLLAIVACFVLAALNVSAQSTFGSIRGTVQDVSGAVVPDAAVTVHSLDENFERDVTTDGSGDFVVENLKPGHYKLTVHHDGFADAVIESAALEARQELRVPITLGLQPRRRSCR